VVRTSPGVEFFGTEKIRNIMIDILFCYSREHPDLCYRQVCNLLISFFFLLMFLTPSIVVDMLNVDDNLK